MLINNTAQDSDVFYVGSTYTLSTVDIRIPMSTEEIGGRTKYITIKNLDTASEVTIIPANVDLPPWAENTGFVLRPGQEVKLRGPYFQSILATPFDVKGISGKKISVLWEITRP